MAIKQTLISISSEPDSSKSLWITTQLTLPSCLESVCMGNIVSRFQIWEVKKKTNQLTGPKSYFEFPGKRATSQSMNNFLEIFLTGIFVPSYFLPKMWGIFSRMDRTSEIPQFSDFPAKHFPRKFFAQFVSVLIGFRLNEKHSCWLCLWRETSTIKEQAWFIWLVSLQLIKWTKYYLIILLW